MSDLNVVAAFAQEFERYRMLVDQGVRDLPDDDFFRQPGPQVNSIALVMKHVAGNLASRWTDFLTTDGDKPTRDRDSEFVLGPSDTRAGLLAAWGTAWSTVQQTLQSLGDEDLSRQVTIRGEPHTVLEALLRSVNHTAYHAGQILYLARLLRPDAPWLTIAPGKSKEHGAGKYLRK